MAKRTAQLPPDAQPIDTTASIANDAYTQFLSAVGALQRGGRVKVSRVIDGRRIGLPGGMFDAQGFDDLKVGEKFGGGVYFAQMIDADGTYGKGATFELAGAPVDPAPPQAAQTAPAVDPVAAAIAAMRDMLGPVIERVNRLDNAAQQPNTLELVRAIAETMRPVQQAQQPAPQGLGVAELLPYLLKQTGPTAGLSDLMTLAEKLAGKMPGSAAAPKEKDDDTTASIIGTVIGEVLAGIQKARATAAQQPAPQLGALPQPSPSPVQSVPGAAQASPAPGPTTATEPNPFPPLEAPMVAVLQIIRAQVKDRADGNDDAPTAAAIITSILGEDGARDFATKYTDAAYAPLVRVALEHYAPDLATEADFIGGIARAVTAALATV